MVELSRRLRSIGAESLLVFERPPIEPLRRRFEEAGARLEYMQASDRYGKTFNLVRKHRPAVVHFHFYSQFSWLPLVAKIAGGGRVMFTEHIRQPHNFGCLKQAQLRLCDLMLGDLLNSKVLAVSAYIRQVLISDYQAKPAHVEILRNGINLERFHPLPPGELRSLRQKLGLPGEAEIVLSASNLRPEKGIDILLRAFAKLNRKLPRAMLVIVGDGPVRNELHELATNLSLGESVRFLGLRSDVQSFMQAADVLAVCSTWQEPAGLVVLEAMACGKPVVVTRVGGMPEAVVEGETGFVVAPSSDEELADALLSLLQNPERAKCMGSAARNHVVKEYSMGGWVEATLQHYGLAMKNDGVPMN